MPYSYDELDRLLGTQPDTTEEEERRRWAAELARLGVDINDLPPDYAPSRPGIPQQKLAPEEPPLFDTGTFQPPTYADRRDTGRVSYEPRMPMADDAYQPVREPAQAAPREPSRIGPRWDDPEIIERGNQLREQGYTHDPMTGRWLGDPQPQTPVSAGPGMTAQDVAAWERGTAQGQLGQPPGAPPVIRELRGTRRSQSVFGPNGEMIHEPGWNQTDPRMFADPNTPPPTRQGTFSREGGTPGLDQETIRLMDQQARSSLSSAERARLSQLQAGRLSAAADFRAGRIDRLTLENAQRQMADESNSLETRLRNGHLAGVVLQNRNLDQTNAQAAQHARLWGETAEGGAARQIRNQQGEPIGNVFFGPNGAMHIIPPQPDRAQLREQRLADIAEQRDASTRTHLLQEATRHQQDIMRESADLRKPENALNFPADHWSRTPAGQEAEIDRRMALTRRAIDRVNNPQPAPPATPPAPALPSGPIPREIAQRPSSIPAARVAELRDIANSAYRQAGVRPTLIEPERPAGVIGRINTGAREAADWTTNQFARRMGSNIQLGQMIDILERAHNEERPLRIGERAVYEQLLGTLQASNPALARRLGLVVQQQR